MSRIRSEISTAAKPRDTPGLRVARDVRVSHKRAMMRLIAMATQRADETAGLKAFAPWFYAAAAYNLAWGASVIVFPSLLFDLLGLDAPSYLPIWQVVGMFVLVYAPAYWWAARFPERYPLFIVIGMLGKLMGPVGFAWAVAFSDFPVEFGVTIITNDLIWYPAFLLYLRRAARLRGGWRRLLSGE